MWIINLTQFPSFNISFSVVFWVWTVLFGILIGLKFFKHA